MVKVLLIILAILALVPWQAEAVAPMEPSGSVECVVRAGETIWALEPLLWHEAITMNPWLVARGRVSERNGITYVLIYPGERLRLPRLPAVAAAAYYLRTVRMASVGAVHGVVAGTLIAMASGDNIRCSRHP